MLNQVFEFEFELSVSVSAHRISFKNHAETRPKGIESKHVLEWVEENGEWRCPPHQTNSLWTKFRLKQRYVINPYHAFSSSVFSSPSKQISVEEKPFRSSQSFQSSGSSAACVECRTPTVSATDTLTRFTRPVPLDKCV